jgi:hypothetical protein
MTGNKSRRRLVLLGRDGFYIALSPNAMPVQRFHESDGTSSGAVASFGVRQGRQKTDSQKARSGFTHEGPSESVGLQGARCSVSVFSNAFCVFSGKKSNSPRSEFCTMTAAWAVPLGQILMRQCKAPACWDDQPPCRTQAFAQPGQMALGNGGVLVTRLLAQVCKKEAICRVVSSTCG